MYYAADTNYWYQYSNDIWNTVSLCNIGLVKQSEAAITNSLVYKPITLLSRGDSGFITKLSMPSDKYIDLAVLPSGYEYIAPADGYFSLYITTGQSLNGWASLSNDTNGIITKNAVANGPYTSGVFLPCKKGDKIVIGYSGYNLSINRFIFIYAQGVVND